MILRLRDLKLVGVLDIYPSFPERVWRQKQFSECPQILPRKGRERYHRFAISEFAITLGLWRRDKEGICRFQE